MNQLNRRTPVSDIWKFIKTIRNKSDFGKNQISEDLIQQLLDRFAPLSASTAPLTSNNDNHQTFTFTALPQSIIDKPFTHQELDLSLKNCRNTAPGMDKFTYKIIFNLTNASKIILLQIFNDWWINHNFIKNFKIIIICLILKPSKDPNTTDSYRPISLLSCIVKTFERMIKFRLEFHVENNAVLPMSQYGFRRGRGTIDAVAQLVLDVQINFSKNGYVLCWFIDLKGAYDGVNLQVLLQKLTSMGLSARAAASIIELFRNRTIFIRDHKNALYGPRIVYNGLPQGSILSPLLFNVYTADLHDMFDDRIRIIQYADDICLYTIHNSYDRCLENLKFMVNSVNNWLIQVGLEMSPEKSAIMCFTRHRLALPDFLNVGGYDIPVVNQYKYLGIVLDQKLLWSKHIQYVKNKCEKGINILKCTTKKKWGADPRISLIFYRSYIRSILDYGCILYGSASNCHLKKVDRIQYESLKICIGAMKSSPCRAIQAEAQEPPLNIRRQYLAEKAVIKYRSYNQFLLNKINKLSTENYVNSFWAKKNSPPLADAFVDTSPLDGYITCQEKYPLYQCNYEVLLTSYTVIIPKYSEIPSLNTTILLAVLSGISANNIIYTDGSKSDIGTGSAFYVSSTNYVAKFRIPDICSVFTAEAFAIFKALIWCIDNNAQNSTIVSDSQSVLEAINGNPVKFYNNPIICNIKKLLWYSLSKEIVINFVWTKGHAGIDGNEIVDKAAKSACSLAVTTDVPVFSDLFIGMKTNVRKRWEITWNEFISESHNHYTLIHPTLPKMITHLDTYYINREYSTTITRLKLNHGCFPSHLYRIGRIHSPLCPCDNISYADLNHIFFGCNFYTDLSNELISDLLNLNIQLPLNITHLLALFNKHIYDTIVKFLKRVNINL